jgi:outer membrane protein assembly factor BamE (lipoprotein component of BamABCDE complex)
MRHAPAPATLVAATILAAIAAMTLPAGCGLSYQAASAYRANKMETELKPGDKMAQVRQRFGEPDIEDSPNDQTEVWSYAKHANSNDVAAEVFYTSAKDGDKGTFEDLKFNSGTLVSWGEAQHIMPAKENTGLNTNFNYGRGGGGKRSGAGVQSGSAASQSSGSSNSDTSDNPFEVSY